GGLSAIRAEKVRATSCYRCWMASSTEAASARQHVAGAARRLAAQGLVLGTAGNISERVGDDRVAISPTGVSLESLTAEQVCVIDHDGELAEGELEPTS